MTCGGIVLRGVPGDRVDAGASLQAVPRLKPSSMDRAASAAVPTCAPRNCRSRSSASPRRLVITKRCSAGTEARQFVPEPGIFFSLDKTRSPAAIDDGWCSSRTHQFTSNRAYRPGRPSG
ncbi:hypothetical protein ACWC9Q_31855 [Streptomyces sp. NPDC001142]